MNKVSLAVCCSSLLTELLHETLQFHGRHVSGGTRLGVCHYSVQLLKSLALWMLNNSEIGSSVAIFCEELHFFHCASVRRQKSVPCARYRFCKCSFARQVCSRSQHTT